MEERMLYGNFEVAALPYTRALRTITGLGVGKLTIFSRSTRSPVDTAWLSLTARSSSLQLLDAGAYISPHTPAPRPRVGFRLNVPGQRKATSKAEALGEDNVFLFPFQPK